MTTLGVEFIKGDGNSEIVMVVAGDLSHSYRLRRAGSNGIGYAFPTKSRAEIGMKKARQLGYGSDKFKRWYDPISKNFSAT